MMHNRLGDFEDYSYLGLSPQPLFKKYSIISNNECSVMADSLQPFKPSLQEDSFDLQLDECYLSKV